MNVSPQYFADHFDDLASAVNKGELVDVSLPEKPRLRLVWADMQTQRSMEPRELGAGKALRSLPTEVQLEEIDREWKLALKTKSAACLT